MDLTKHFQHVTDTLPYPYIRRHGHSCRYLHTHIETLQPSREGDWKKRRKKSLLCPGPAIHWNRYSCICRSSSHARTADRRATPWALQKRATPPSPVIVKYTTHKLRWIQRQRERQIAKERSMEGIVRWHIHRDRGPVDRSKMLDR